MRLFALGSRVAGTGGAEIRTRGRGGDPDGDVMTPGWFVHVWHRQRGVRHFETITAARSASRLLRHTLSDQQTREELLRRYCRSCRSGLSVGDLLGAGAGVLKEQGRARPIEEQLRRALEGQPIHDLQLLDEDPPSRHVISGSTGSLLPSASGPVVPSDQRNGCAADETLCQGAARFAM